MRTAREYKEREVTKKAMRSIFYNREFDGLRWVESPNCGLRFVDFVDQIPGTRISHKGWYIDDMQSETLRGVVYRLPHGKFVPGYISSEKCGHHGGACLSFKEATTDISEAIRDADGLADKEAEKSRAYNDAWRAGRDHYQAHEEIHALWSGLRLIARERRDLKKAGGDWPHIMLTLEQKMQDMLETIREKKKISDDLFISYGETEAFKEGNNG